MIIFTNCVKIFDIAITNSISRIDCIQFMLNFQPENSLSLSYELMLHHVSSQQLRISNSTCIRVLSFREAIFVSTDLNVGPWCNWMDYFAPNLSINPIFRIWKKNNEHADLSSRFFLSIFSLTNQNIFIIYQRSCDLYL